MESLRILIDLYILEKEQSENKRKPFIDKDLFVFNHPSLRTHCTTSRVQTSAKPE